MGARLVLKNYSPKILFGRILQAISDCPSLLLVGIGYAIVFFFYFIKPTFLNPYRELIFFHDFPVLKPLGADLREYLTFSNSLLEIGTPYILPNYYPPLQALFFLWFARMGPDQAYIYLTSINFLCFLAVSFFFPILFSSRHKLNSLAFFWFVTGLFSYGFLFELERGQFDLIVMAICFLAIYIFHKHPRLRLISYILFVVSVNLKIYPAIFVFCFATDLHQWRKNLRLWLLLLIASGAGLFILGWAVFLDFIAALNNQLSNPTYWWVGNHSIDSFLRLAMEKLQDNNPSIYASLFPNIQWLILLVMLVFFLFFCVVMFIASRYHLSGANPYLLLVVMLGSLILPSTSHDYKLCILVPSIVYLFNNLDQKHIGNSVSRILVSILLLVITVSYSSTLFLHVNLPFFLSNNFPTLMILAVASILLFSLQTKLSVRNPQQRSQ